MLFLLSPHGDAIKAIITKIFAWPVWREGKTLAKHPCSETCPTEPVTFVSHVKGRKICTNKFLTQDTPIYTYVVRDVWTIAWALVAISSIFSLGVVGDCAKYHHILDVNLISGFREFHNKAWVHGSTLAPGDDSGILICGEEEFQQKYSSRPPFSRLMCMSFQERLRSLLIVFYVIHPCKFPVAVLYDDRSFQGTWVKKGHRIHATRMSPVQWNYYVKGLPQTSSLWTGAPLP